MRGKFIETHCHLDYLKEQTPEETVNKSLEVGVDKIVTIAVEPDNQDLVLDLSNNFPNVYCSQGIHPHEAKLWNDDVKEKIIKNSQSNKVKAIGEIGLDYHYDHSPRDIQRKVFEEQLQVSLDLKLPVIVHSREAESDTKSILDNFKEMLTTVIIHCFTSSIDFAEYSIKEGYYLGFNGIITFRPAENVREVLVMTPAELILLETDAPFLTPNPFRGKENAPFYLPHIAKKCAETKNMPLEELLNQIYINSTKAFRL